MIPRHICHAVAAGCVLSAVAGMARGECTFTWTPGQGLPGLDSTVWAMTVWDDGGGPALCVGGDFSVAGDVAAEHIARWRGHAWSPLGGGITGTVSAMTVYNGELMVGRQIFTAGGSEVAQIVRWDGASWSAVGGGINIDLYVLAVHDGDLIAGGYFTEAGDGRADYIARWDGSDWFALASGDVAADLDGDCDVDAEDFAAFAACAAGPAMPLASGCEAMDLDDDGDGDMSDFGLFQRCYSGEGLPAVLGCADQAGIAMAP